MESANTESAITESMSIESVNTETVNTNIVNIEGINAESVSTENVNTDDMSNESASSKSVITQSENTESVNAESVSTTNMNIDSGNSKSVSTESVNTENMISENVNTESENFENVDTKSVTTETENTDNVHTQSVTTESASTESVSTESVNTENMNTESGNSESVNTKNVTTESEDTESVNTKSVTTEISDNTESMNSESANTELVNSDSGNSQNTESVHTESGNSKSENTDSVDAPLNEVEVHFAEHCTHFSQTSLQAQSCPSFPSSLESSSEPQSSDTLALQDTDKLDEVLNKKETSFLQILDLNSKKSCSTPNVTGCTLKSSVSAPNLTDYILDTVSVTKSSSLPDISPETVHDTGSDISSSASETGLALLRRLIEAYPILDDDDYVGNTLTECQVCLDPTRISLISIRHCCQFKVCSDCLKSYVSFKVLEGNVGNIQCLNTECQTRLTEFEIINNLSTALKMKYHKFLIDGGKDPTLKTCPSCDHEQRVTKKALKNKDTKKKGLEVTCATCALRWCFLCQAPWHEGLTCKEYRQGDEEFQQWTQQQQKTGRGSTTNYNAQKCPACKIYIQRSSGCPHMTCSRCSTEFCYHCGNRFFLTDTEYRIYRRKVFRYLLGGHSHRFSVLGCRHLLLPNSNTGRRLVRGSLFGVRIMGGVCALGVAAVAIGVAPVALPVYGAVKLVKKIRSR